VCCGPYLNIAIDKLCAHASDSRVPGRHVRLSFLRILVCGCDLKSKHVDLLPSLVQRSRPCIFLDCCFVPNTEAYKTVCHKSGCKKGLSCWHEMPSQILFAGVQKDTRVRMHACAHTSSAVFNDVFASSTACTAVAAVEAPAAEESDFRVAASAAFAAC